MYFPYLRCKQFELIALRELAPLLGRSKKVSPVLEPLKKASAPLIKTLDVLSTNDVNFTIVINPMVGDLKSDVDEIPEIINNNLSRNNNFQLGLLINSNIDFERVNTILEKLNVVAPLTLLHRHKLHDTEALAAITAGRLVKYNLFNENFPIRRYRGIIDSTSKVIFDDKFVQQVKNADYISCPDEFFSDDYYYFEEDGFIGYGDYLTIGEDYSESGFLPYAVAIHFTYEKDGNAIHIRHFVSDNNSDNSDIPGKFGEALVKLIAFINDHNIQTEAANEFRELYRLNHYPGLGSIKKLSIKNHIELNVTLLD